LSNNVIKVNPRMVALNALMRIEQGEFSHVVIRDTLDENTTLSRQDKAFIKRLVTGTMNNKLQLDYILKQFIEKDLKKIKPVVLLILRSAVYQMLYMDTVPDNAACNEAVKLTEKKRFQGLKGFVNGVLRNVARNKDKISNFDNIADVNTRISVKYSTPLWLVDMWLEEYGRELTEKMLSAFDKESLVTIRVNPTKATLTELEDNLNNEQVSYEKHPYLEEAFVITNIDNIQTLTAFQKGLFQIQDVSSMIVGVAAAFKEGQKVLDICAAPGGKSMHAAALVGKSGQVISNDLTEKKAQLIRENALRQGFENITTTVMDACEYKPEYEEAFDVVIADVPCSGLGVIGRKSDIKYRVTRTDIDALVELQRKILANAYRYVKQGGTLMFSTCTVNKNENDANVKWLRENYNLKLVDFSMELQPPLSEEASVKEGYLQLIPGKHLTDGFFLAKFCKET